MATLRIRMYNVHFGDAILVSVSDRDPVTRKATRRNLLIDVGNVLWGDGGVDEVFRPVVDDILRQLRGQPLDLYVMTHEHLDHVQGLPYAAKHFFPEGELRRRLATRFAWLTASAAPDYYDTHPAARQKRVQALKAFRAARRSLNALPASSGTRQAFAAFLANNDPRSTGECVEYLRELAATTTYVHRETDLQGTHPFKEVEFSVWAPEEDTSDYYGRFRPLTADDGSGDAPSWEAGDGPTLAALPPSGVDAGAFYGLVRSRDRGFADNLLAIDKAANDSSIVFSLRWRGWTVLFPGDAETRSWQTMHREGVLRPVHVLKVSHHGSHNGTPDGAILEAILPAVPPDRRRRRALVSTHPGTYSGIPHDPTDARLAGRAQLLSTAGDPQAPWVDVLLND